MVVCKCLCFDEGYVKSKIAFEFDSDSEFLYPLNDVSTGTWKENVERGVILFLQDTGTSACSVAEKENYPGKATISERKYVENDAENLHCISWWVFSISRHS